MNERLLTPTGSAAENLFIELFSDTFGAEKAGYLYPQYHFTDIYQNDRYADFFWKTAESGFRSRLMMKPATIRLWCRRASSMTTC